MANKLPDLTSPAFLDFTDLEKWFNKEIIPLYGSNILPSLVPFRKVAEEMGEWLDAANIEEALDTIMSLWIWIRLQPDAPADINAAMEAKVFKLFAREWELLPDGRWHHVKEP